MSVIFKIFIFQKKKETKMKIKTKKYFFIFGRGPTRFDLAPPTYLHPEWRIRVT